MHFCILFLYAFKHSWMSSGESCVCAYNILLFYAPSHQSVFPLWNFSTLETEKSYKNRGLVNSVGVPSLWYVLGVKSCFTDGTE